MCGDPTGTKCVQFFLCRKNRREIMANICGRNISASYNREKPADKTAIQIQLQDANINGLTDMDAKCSGSLENKLKRLKGNDGETIADYLTSLFNDPRAAADVQQMVTNLQAKGPAFIKSTPAATKVRVRFHDNFNAAATGTSLAGKYNFFFNLDIWETPHNYKELVTITFHTGLIPKKALYNGGFHLRDKSDPLGIHYQLTKLPNPYWENFIRLKICQRPTRGGTDPIKISRVYTKNPAKGAIDYSIVDPFLNNFINIFETYLNNACTLPKYVPIPAPTPPTPPVTTTTTTPAVISTVNNLMKKYGLNKSANTSTSAPPPPAPPADNGSAWGGYKKRKTTRRRKQRKSKTRKNRTA